MKRFRTVRGGIGTTVHANSAREAVEKDNEITNKAFQNEELVMFIGKFDPPPITEVWEVVKVPEEEWK